MRRCAIVLFLLVWVSACAELEPTPTAEPTSTPEPTATPWPDRDACVELNEVVDNWLAGVGSGDGDQFEADLRSIRDKLSRGPNARNSMDEFLALVDTSRRVSDYEFESKFNAVLTACELSLLPTPESELEPVRILTPIPTRQPTHEATSTPVETRSLKDTPQYIIVNAHRAVNAGAARFLGFVREKDDSLRIVVIDVVRDFIRRDGWVFFDIIGTWLDPSYWDAPDYDIDDDYSLNDMNVAKDLRGVVPNDYGQALQSLAYLNYARFIELNLAAIKDEIWTVVERRTSVRRNAGFRDDDRRELRDLYDAGLRDEIDERPRISEMRHLETLVAAANALYINVFDQHRGTGIGGVREMQMVRIPEVCTDTLEYMPPRGCN